MLSHEYVKAELLKLGFEKPHVGAMANRMGRLTFGVKALEETLVSISGQLAKAPGKRSRLTIGRLQALYQDLMLMVLRDKLLFNGACMRSEAW